VTELYAGLDAPTATGIYTNSSGITESIQQINFVNSIENPANDGTPFTQVLVSTQHLNAGTWKVTGQFLFLPTTLSSYSPTILASYANLNNIFLVLGPGDQIVVTAYRGLSEYYNGDPTDAFFTISGQQFPGSSTSVPWQTYETVNTPSKETIDNYSGYEGITTYTNSTSANQTISTLAFYGELSMSQVRLYLKTKSGSGTATSGDVELFPLNNNVGVGSVFESNLGLLLKPGDSLEIVGYSSSQYSQGSITLSGYSTAVSASPGPWQGIVTLSDPQYNSVSVNTVTTYYTNSSKTVGQIINSISFVNQASDVTDSGLAFSTLNLYVQSLKGSTWQTTGQAFLVPNEVNQPFISGPSGNSTALLTGGLNLVMNPGDRLMVVGTRNASIYGGSTQNPTLAHLTISGITFTP
jgi:hypothetical protein